VALAGTVMLLAAAPASASTTITVEDGSPDYPYQRWVDKAKVPTPDVPVEVREEPCGDPGLRACTDLHPGGSATMYLPPQRGARALFYHELGHVFYWNIDESDYARITAKLTTADAQARTDAYSVCARRNKPRFRDGFGVMDGPYIGKRDLRRACRAIRATEGT
jgi:hypothetical protein